MSKFIPNSPFSRRELREELGINEGLTEDEIRVKQPVGLYVTNSRAQRELLRGVQGRMASIPGTRAYREAMVALSATSAFSPAALFANSEPGFWYDPSPSTCFTDTAGTTPAAVGDAVALMLDKSQGLKMGPELVTNGTFDTDLTGWTDSSTGTGSVEFSSGAALLTTVDSSNRGRLSQSLPLASGKFYELTFVGSAATEASGGVFVGGSLVASAVGNGVRSVLFLASGTSTLEFFGTFNAGSILFDNISVRELPGNHATQATTAARPILRQSGSLYYLEFDGTDDFLVTPTITPGTDKVQVFAGVRKLSDAARGMVAELSASAASNNGAFTLTAPDAASATFAFESKGTTLTSAVDTGISAPATRVLTGLGDIAGDSATARLNGVQEAQATTDQGTGNYLAYPMYIGARAGTSLFFDGHIYSMIVRFGENLDATAISRTETYVAAKTGVTL